MTQLLRFDFAVERYMIQGVPLQITDAPRFAWRELMVDTSRRKTFSALTIGIARAPARLMHVCPIMTATEYTSKPHCVYECAVLSSQNKGGQCGSSTGTAFTTHFSQTPIVL